MMKGPKKKKAKRKKDMKPATPDPVSRCPDFAARAQKIFGDRVLNTVEDFLKYRHREWEQ